ncbi:MAG: DNA repair protein RecO, partial [Kiritimatiellia bacterium]
MIVRTKALVLRVVSFSETSQVVTWLTPGLGKLTTLIKGALRRGSPFQGQYDLFYTSELIYYERRQSEIHVAGECAVLKHRPQLR